jgi:hypothetical protein
MEAHLAALNRTRERRKTSGVFDIGIMHKKLGNLPNPANIQLVLTVLVHSNSSNCLVSSMSEVLLCFPPLLGALGSFSVLSHFISRFRHLDYAKGDGYGVITVIPFTWNTDLYHAYIYTSSAPE